MSFAGARVMFSVVDEAAALQDLGCIAGDVTELGWSDGIPETLGAAVDDSPALRTSFAPAKVNFKTAGFSLDALEAAIGALTPAPAVRSVVFETTERVPGDPRRPVRRRGFWAWLTGANAAAERSWRGRYAAWVAAGRPDVDQMTRFYIPRATFNLMEP